MKILHRVKCNNCGSKEYSTLLTIEKEIINNTCTFSIVKCKKCGLVYSTPRLSKKSLSIIYDQSYDEVENVVEHVNKIKSNNFIRRIYNIITAEYRGEVIRKATGKVLDIGCGRGMLLEEIKERGCEVYGTEVNPKSQKICEKKGIKFYSGEVEELKFDDNFFDTVILWHVVEHLEKPQQTIQEILRILKPGGRLFISTPNIKSYLRKIFGEFWIAWYIPCHLYYFSKDSIVNLFKQTDFKITKSFTTSSVYFFRCSLANALRGKKLGILKILTGNGKIFGILALRVLLALVFRISDFIFREGDMLNIEVTKNDK